LNATYINDRPSGARQRFIGIYTELMKRLPNAEFVVYEPVDCRMSSWFQGMPNVSCSEVGRNKPAPAGVSGFHWVFATFF